MEYDTENMNSEEIYSSLRGVTEAIQSFSYRSQEDLNEPIRPEGKRDDAVSLFHQKQKENVFLWLQLLQLQTLLPASPTCPMICPPLHHWTSGPQTLYACLSVLKT